MLKGDAKLTIDSLGAFESLRSQTNPPTIALTDAPRPNARGSLTLKYADHRRLWRDQRRGVFANPVVPDGKPARRSLVEAPKAASAASAGRQQDGEAETTIDLSDNPWAGAKVEMTLDRAR